MLVFFFFLLSFFFFLFFLPIKKGVPDLVLSAGVKLGRSLGSAHDKPLSLLIKRWPFHSPLFFATFCIFNESDEIGRMTNCHRGADARPS